MEEATIEVHHGRAAGTMYFAKNFSKAMMKRRDIFNSIRKSDWDLIAGEIQTTLDMSGKYF